MRKIIKYVMLDILRNKIIIAYACLLVLLGFSLFNMNDSTDKGLLSLMNVVLIIVPLVSLVFSAIYLYNATEFIELLVSQPIRRRDIWLSLFTGLAGSLAIAFLAGCSIPVLISGAMKEVGLLLFIGTLLSIIFAAIAMLAVVHTRDKARGIGLTTMLWLFFTLLFDGIVLFILFQFMDYPLEKAMIVMSMLNPIDLSRVIMLLQLDISAMMGVTSAVFRSAFGSPLGMGIAIAVLLMWVVLPLWSSLRTFQHKDL
jgi:Cu-processing system permease protein